MCCTASVTTSTVHCGDCKQQIRINCLDFIPFTDSFAALLMALEGNKDIVWLFGLKLGKSLMAKWLEQASQLLEMYCHDLEVMSSSPSQVELGVLGTYVLSRT